MINIKKMTIYTSLGIALTVATTVHAQQHNITVAANVTQMHWLSTQSYEPLQQCITDGTDGEITFQYFPASQLGDAYQMVEVLNSGLANMSLVSPSFASDRLPLNGIPLLPGLGDSAVDVVESYRAALNEDTLIAKELKDKNVHPIAIHVFPPYQILMRGAPVTQVSELEGKKIRAGGGTLNFTASALGGVVVGMGSGDVYLALQQGVVDGTLLSATSIEPYKLNEVVESMSANASLGVAASLWAFDTDTWSAFSPSKRKLSPSAVLKLKPMSELGLMKKICVPLIKCAT